MKILGPPQALIGGEVAHPAIQPPVSRHITPVKEVQIVDAAEMLLSLGDCLLQVERFRDRIKEGVIPV
jgi:hypothetical protein